MKKWLLGGVLVATLSITGFCEEEFEMSFGYNLISATYKVWEREKDKRIWGGGSWSEGTSFKESDKWMPFNSFSIRGTKMTKAYISGGLEVGIEMSGSVFSNSWEIPDSATYNILAASGGARYSFPYDGIFFIEEGVVHNAMACPQKLVQLEVNNFVNNALATVFTVAFSFLLTKAGF